MTDEFDLPPPNYIEEDAGFWICNAAGTEITFRGGPDGIDPTSVMLAQRVLANLAVLEAEGRTYLHGFVDMASFNECREYYKIESAGEWRLLGADFGRRADIPANGFELLYTLHEDVYGLWGVRFDYDAEHNVSFPVEFRRTQW